MYHLLGKPPYRQECRRLGPSIYIYIYMGPLGPVKLETVTVWTAAVVAAVGVLGGSSYGGALSKRKVVLPRCFAGDGFIS